MRLSGYEPSENRPWVSGAGGEIVPNAMIALFGRPCQQVIWTYFAVSEVLCYYSGSR